jgi:hypothetical protein
MSTSREKEEAIGRLPREQGFALGERRQQRIDERSTQNA